MSSHTGGKGKGKSISKAQLYGRAGLTLPASKFRRFQQRRFKQGTRETRNVSRATTAIAEYLITEMLDLAGNITRDHRRKVISARDVSFALRSDPEFRQSLRKTTIIGESCPLVINPQLLPTKKRRRSKKRNKEKKEHAEEAEAEGE